MKLSVSPSSIFAVFVLVVAVSLVGLRHETQSLRAELLVMQTEITELNTKALASGLSFRASQAQQISLAPQSLSTIQSRAQKVSMPLPMEGQYSRESGAIVYDSNAKVRIEKDVVISSPTGVMVSDENQKIFVGDLRLEKNGNILDATDAVIDVEKHTFVMKSAGTAPQKTTPSPADVVKRSQSEN